MEIKVVKLIENLVVNFMFFYFIKFVYDLFYIGIFNKKIVCIKNYVFIIFICLMIYLLLFEIDSFLFILKLILFFFVFLLKGMINVRNNGKIF